ncbi:MULTISPECIES: B3/4 domain-containing protein [unclassified Sinorhizobium]|uniref:B3/B4 domain-containing protein n=1 Tax=unclassified Sinorhizobium TaxID=2613772 RepID=UPI003524B2FA
MHFRHSNEIWREFPELVAGVVFAEGIGKNVSVGLRIEEFQAAAAARLAMGPEGEFPEIQAWRRTFARMGLKPTQYRCASEALLRRFRQEKSLPQLHPLVDLCNAISLAFAIPIAVFDVSRIADHLEVRHAQGHETYLTFAGETEHPSVLEVIFADGEGRAHARRWTNRQSGYSAVGEGTSAALIVAEAMHASAAEDVAKLVAAIKEEIGELWSSAAKSGILNQASPRFDF